MNNPIAKVAGELWATIRTEITMQWRRQGFWALFAFLGLVLLLPTLQGGGFFRQLPANYFGSYVPTPSELEGLFVHSATAYAALFLGLIVALLVADRLERDVILGVRELQRTTPQRTATYIVGKYLGNCSAMLVPLAAIYLLCGVIAVSFGWSGALVLDFLLIFALITLPSVLVAIAMVLCLVSLFPLRVVQILFVLVWFQLYIGLGWHGLSESVFNVSGAYIYPILFPLSPELQQFAVLDLNATLALAVLNVATLLVTTLSALIVTYLRLIQVDRRMEVVA